MMATAPTFSLLPSTETTPFSHYHHMDTSGGDVGDGGGDGLRTRNSNIHVMTAITQVRMVNPIDCSEVSNELDKKRLLEVDRLICNLTDAMPLLQKSKPKRVGTKYYNVTYSWDDVHHMFSGAVLNQSIYEKGFLRGWYFNNRHLRFEVWTDEEYRRQHGLAQGQSEERPNKRPRIELEHD